MGYPLSNGSDPYHSYTFYQGVMVGELICTVALFLTLQALHYCLWGHEQQQWEFKKNEEGDSAVEPLPKSEWKWDQKSFNMYFAIIFGNHVSALVLPLAYYPSIFTCAAAYVHVGSFLGILITTVCVDEKEPGKGGRTTTNRIFWILMCLVNLVLIAAGLTGIPTVIA